MKRSHWLITFAVAVLIYILPELFGWLVILALVIWFAATSGEPVTG